MAFANYRCSRCDSPRVRATHATIESAWGEARFTIEGVPVEQCEVCGQNHLSPDVSEKLQELMKKHVAQAEAKIRERFIYA